MAKPRWGRLPQAFAAYAAYHNNPVNQMIHVVFVPLILLTAFVFFTYAPISEASAPAKALLAHVPWMVPSGINFGLLIALSYACYYVYLSPSWVGLTAALLVFAEFIGAQHWRAAAGPTAWQAALGLHAVSWIAQFYGHGVHEGRQPALIDNLFQALFLAPLFVFLETIISVGLLGDFHAEAKPITEANIKKWQAEKGAAKRAL